MNPHSPESRLEARRVISGVFDSATSSTLYTLARKYDLSMEGLISIGKEANVYQGYVKDKRVAVKIYRIEAGDFNLMRKYIAGDFRFGQVNSKRRLIYDWTKREFLNMERAFECGCCPEPIACQKNVLVMGLVTRNNLPAPKLKDANLENPEECFKEIVNFIKGIYSKGIVHGDLSEYNVLISDNDKPVLIDFSMGTLVENAISGELLKRDINNIVRYFRKLGVSADEESVVNSIDPISSSLL